MAFSKESTEIIDELHKVAHSEGDIVMDEEVFKPLIPLLTSLLNAKTTIKDFAKQQNVDERYLRVRASRICTEKPQRATLWSFKSLFGLIKK